MGKQGFGAWDIPADFSQFGFLCANNTKKLSKTPWKKTIFLLKKFSDLDGNTQEIQEIFRSLIHKHNAQPMQEWVKSVQKACMSCERSSMC